MKKYFYLLLLPLIMAGGCERFLDVKSDARLVVPHTLEDAQALLDDKLRMLERTVPGWGQDVSDDYYLNETVFNGLTINRARFYLWDYPEYFGFTNDWGAGYAPIFNANLAMDLLENTERNPANAGDWDNVKGSALFYRAFFFFKLLVVFSPAYDENTADTDLGIALRLDTDFNKLSVRASVKDCYDQIFQDLTAALEYLPDYPRHVTRPSKGAVYGLLSNIYLYRMDYVKALEFADLALSYNDELIDLNGDDELGSMTTTSTPFSKFNKETIFYAELANAVAFSRTRALIDTNLIGIYLPEDLRMLAFFRPSDGDHYFKGNLTGENARLFAGLSTSEVYLNKAESLAKLDRPKEAIVTLNLLLIKRYENGATLPKSEDFDGQAALDYVRRERRKELLFRGIRFADLKRYNKEGANIYIVRHAGGKEYRLEPNSSKYNLPLPADIIEYTGMEQN